MSPLTHSRLEGRHAIQHVTQETLSALVVRRSFGNATRGLRSGGNAKGSKPHALGALFLLPASTTHFGCFSSIATSVTRLVQQTVISLAQARNVTQWLLQTIRKQG